MKYTLVIKEEAQDDIDAAYIWYENKLEGLGEKFVEALDSCFHHITHNPFMFEIKYKDVRFGFIDTFPYVAIYRIENNSIIIHAIYNTHKNPKGWKKKFKFLS